MSNDNPGAQANATSHAATREADHRAAGGPAGELAGGPPSESMGAGAGPAAQRSFRRALASALWHVFAFLLVFVPIMLLVLATLPPSFPHCDDPAILPRVTKFAGSQFSHQRGRPVEARFTTSPKQLSEQSRPAKYVKSVYFRVCKARLTVEGVAYDYRFGMRREEDDDEGFLLEPPW